ncbi:MAG: hypothetical protein ACOCUW_04180, partial [Gemmatimonadota bacterium]
MGVLLLGAAALAGCGGEPPEGLAGFRLGMTQPELLAEADARMGFTCRARATRPPQTACAGPAEEGQVEAVVRGDSVVRITLELARDAADPSAAADAVRRFVRGFGDPAWRDRPYPPPSGPRPSDPPEGYHTFWVDVDST